MRPKGPPAGAVDQGNRRADLQPPIRCSADCRSLLGAAGAVGADFAQGTGDAVDLQVAHLAQGEEGGGKIGILRVETVTEQVGFAPTKLRGDLHAGQTGYAAFLERFLKTGSPSRLSWSVSAA